MKKFVISLLTAVLLLGAASVAYANPSVVWTYPPGGSTNVDPTTLNYIWVQWDTPMLLSSFNGRVNINGATVPFSSMIMYNNYNGTGVNWFGFQVNPALAWNSTYTVYIDHRVQDIYGNKMGNNNSYNYTWSFTTAPKPPTDITPPTVVSTFPISNATGVPVSAQITITFSEAMDPATITSANILVNNGAVSGTVSLDSSGTVATFTPISVLNPSTTYSVQVTTSVRDLAGNYMASNYSWSFSTISNDNIPPFITAVSPVNGATGVDPSTAITATFSELMDPSTISTATFSVSGGISGTVSYDPGTMTATFTPSSALAYGTNYTATVTTGVKDLAGNRMSASYSWTFTTVQSITPAPMANYCQTPPFVAGAGTTVKPNVLLVVDNSGSMYEFAYKTEGTGNTDSHGNISYDTSYNSATPYYGYFDSTKMYSYVSSGGYFQVDSTKAQDNNSFWSGNFLNWLTMRRVDIIRKVLVGGKTQPRSANTANYLYPTEDPDRDFYKSYNNVNYMVSGGSATEQVYDKTHNATYKLKIYVGDQPPQDGLVLNYSDKINFGIMSFNDGYSYEDGTNSVRDGGYVNPYIGSTGTNLITQIENTDPSTWTPLGESLYEAVRYFEATTSAYNGGNYSSHDPIQYKCQKNFVLILTDGESTKDQNLPGTAFSSPGHSMSAVSDSYGFNIKTWMDSIASQEGYSSQWGTAANTDKGSYYLEGVAYYAHVTDLRSSSVGNSNFAGTQNLTIYTVFAFDDSPIGRDILMKTSKYGGFDDFDGTNKPDQAGKWDKNGDGIPDTFYQASDGNSLEQSLTSAFNDILARVSSGTAASILSNSEGSGANLLQAVFYPKKYFANGTQATWIGEMQNLWYYLDPYLQNSTIREDSNQDQTLELDTDKVVQFYFDASQNQTLVQRWYDTNGDGAPDTYADTVQPDYVNSLWKAGNLLWSRNITLTPRTIYAGDPSQTTPTMVPFNTSNTTGGIQTKSNWWGYLQAANKTEATKIINYINGTDQSGYRSRTVTIGSSTYPWKLGDIVSSTPKIESNVRLNTYDLATPNGYGDNSYSLYLNSNDYHNREMVYVGANDGMLHAFKLGLLDVSGQTKLVKAHLRGDPTTFGQEQWAFIPKNALPYLKYLADPNYSHIYYVDNTPSIVDASINPVTSDAVKFPGCSAGNYWNCEKRTVFQTDINGKSTGNLDTSNTSWRTILVGGMGLGGASRNSTGSCSATTDCVKTPVDGLGYSSYFALDVTDPNNPVYMWEFDVNSALPGTLGYSTTGPAIVRVGDPYKNGRWFAVFGSGPTGPIDTTNQQFMGTSDQNLQLFIVDLATGQLVRTIDHKIDGTTIPYAFAGSLSNGVIDTDRGIGTTSAGFYKDNAVYIGYVRKDPSTGTWTKGGVVRLVTKESTDPNDWQLSSVIDNTGPVTSSVSKLQDRKNHKLWLYFGTGRYFYKTDDPDNGQTIYGITEPCYTDTDTINSSCSDSITTNQLLNQTTNPVTSLGTNKGWYINLDTSALNDGYSSERVITDPIAATNGAVFFTTFRPTTDLCGFGGNSYLWATRYDTGAQPPEAAMQGKALLQVSTGAFAEISLKSAFTAKNNRRIGSAITGVPPKAQGLALILNPKPTKKILHIQER